MDVPALLRWYRANRRDLPWRREVSPWRTLVSELMCQQTRIDTVLPYFERFMVEFPSPERMAEAPVERVLELWSGLGYYSRARNLHAAAVALSRLGAFPRDEQGLRSLPGVGPYTAGAVGAIALGLDLPVVDGNVERVFARFHAVERPTRAWTWGEAARHLPPGEAGDYDQALMELGALVCTPRSPRCLLCPLRDGCKGTPDAERFPAAKERKAVPRAAAGAAVWRRGEAVLLARRPGTGLLGGLWELPGGEGVLGEVLSTRLGLRLVRAETVATVSHTFTHLHVETTVFRVECEGEPDARHYDEVRFVEPGAIEGMALSNLARKTLAAAGFPVKSSGRASARDARAKELAAGR
ncbi:MAG: A/G-specific adenine glycosylase [Deltaproteobacteria bacterium]|nr:A/G-specific adenine glycosylase [Deltaproteobacteria bacterium]